MSRAFKTPPNLALQSLTEVQKTTSAFMLLLLPKCSLCLAAYLNIFTLMGISVNRFANWVLPLLSLVMISSLAVGFMKSRKLNDYRAFTLSLAGMVLLIFDKMWVQQPALSWISFLLIVSSGIIQLIQSRKACNQ